MIGKGEEAQKPAAILRRCKRTGHAMLAAVTYLSLGVLVARTLPRRRLKFYVLTLATLVTILVGISRVYLGVHYPSDIVAGALLAFTLSIDDFVITFFTIGAGNTLPTLVWGMVRTSLDPTINAIATLLILPPHIYLFIFLVSLPGQFLFGVSLLLTARAFNAESSWATAAYYSACAYLLFYPYGLRSLTVFMASLRAIAEHQVYDTASTRAGYAALRIAWNDTGAVSYRVLRSDSPGEAFLPVAEAQPAGPGSLLDRAVVAGRTYRYRVVAERDVLSLPNGMVEMAAALRPTSTSTKFAREGT